MNEELARFIAELEELGFIIPATPPFPIDEFRRAEEVKKQTFFAINKAKFDELKKKFI